jgi:hypothetical protein
MTTKDLQDNHWCSNDNHWFKATTGQNNQKAIGVQSSTLTLLIRTARDKAMR